MKKILFAVSAASLCFLISCSSKDAGGGKMSETAQKNLDASRAVSKMFETADFSKLGDYIAKDGIDHSDHGDVVGLDSIKAELTAMCAKMSDMKNEVVKELADDEYVFSWQKSSGTMKVAEMGMPAGTHYSFDGIEVSKFKDGKATEHWYFMSNEDLMKMMMPQGSMDKMEIKPDSTKKM